MKLSYTPQRSNRGIEYSFSNQTVTATEDDQTITFDFSDLPEGDVKYLLPNPEKPIVLRAFRREGELHVTLLKPIGPKPVDEEELRDWLKEWEVEPQEV